jgi:hypothetical protein
MVSGRGMKNAEACGTPRKKVKIVKLKVKINFLILNIKNPPKIYVITNYNIYIRRKLS